MVRKSLSLIFLKHPQTSPNSSGSNQTLAQWLLLKNIKVRGGSAVLRGSQSLGERCGVAATGTEKMRSHGMSTSRGIAVGVHPRAERCLGIAAARSIRDEICWILSHRSCFTGGQDYYHLSSSSGSCEPWGNLCPAPSFCLHFIDTDLLLQSSVHASPRPSLPSLCHP